MKIEMLTQAIYNVDNKFAKVHEIINNTEDGLSSRLEDEEDKLSIIIDENKTLRREPDIKSFFVGPLIRLFWTSGDVSSGYQSQSGQPYSC